MAPGTSAGAGNPVPVSTAPGSMGTAAGDESAIPRAPGSGIVFLVLLAVGIAVYATTFDNAFQFDDSHSIVDNPSIRGFGVWRDWFTDLGAFSVLPDNLNYRPLLLLTYAVSYRLSGLDVWGFHLLNLLIHIAVSFVVYAIALRLFDRTALHPVRLRPGFGFPYPPHAAGIALVAALIFLVHPVHSEPVNYISSRSTSLAALGVVSAFAAFLAMARALQAGRTGRALVFALLSVAAYVSGLLTKEIAIVLPALVVLHDLVLDRGEAGDGRRWSVPRVAYYAVLLLVSIGYLLLRVRLIPPSVAAARSAVDRSTYFFTQIRAWLHYLREFVWPAGLNADNTDFGWSSGPGDPAVQLAALLVAAIVAIAIISLRRNRLFAFGLFWFFLSVLPTSSVFPLAEPVNGHRAYLAGVGLTISAVVLVYALVDRMRRLGDLGRQGVLSGVLACVLVLLVLGTSERNRIWQSPRSLWEDVVAKSPGNGRAQMNLGLALMSAGDLAGAARRFDLAVARAPRYALAYVNRAVLRRAVGDPAGATEDTEESLRLEPDNIFVLYWAGKHYAETGNLALAAFYLERACEVSPRHAGALTLLFDVESRRGRFDRLPELLAEIEKIGGATDRMRSLTAYHLLRAGRHEDAARILEPVVARSPEDLEARFNLGFALIGMARYEEAEREFRAVLELDPKNQDAWRNLLWIYGTTGNEAAYRRAREEMSRATGAEADSDTGQEKETAQGIGGEAGADLGAGPGAEAAPDIGGGAELESRTKQRLRGTMPPVLEVPALTPADSSPSRTVPHDE